VSSWLKHRLSAPSSHELAIRGFVTSALERVSHHDVAGIMQAVNDDHMVLCNAPHRGAPRSGFGEGLEGLVGSGACTETPAAPLWTESSAKGLSVTVLTDLRQKLFLGHRSVRQHLAAGGDAALLGHLTHSSACDFVQGRHPGSTCSHSL